MKNRNASNNKKVDSDEKINKYILSALKIIKKCKDVS